MNKYMQFMAIILVYFGFFYDIFDPLIEGNIKLFLIQASLPIFIIILGFFFSIMNDKLGYWESKNDENENTNTRKK